MIDVRELHIGNHVDVRINKVVYHPRVRICRITDDNEVCYKMANDKGLLTAYAYHLQPIPLTAELLQELGFEKTVTGDWMKMIDDTTVYVMLYHKHDMAYVMIFPNVHRKESHVMIPKALHMLEDVVYLTTGKELIDD